METTTTPKWTVYIKIPNAEAERYWNKKQNFKPTKQGNPEGEVWLWEHKGKKKWQQIA